MTKTAHTKGPWRVVKDETAYQVKGFPCIEAENYTVVGVEGMFGDIDVDFANARLIAAAPDLLDALEMMLADPDAIENVNFAKAMIANAKGGAA